MDQPTANVLFSEFYNEIIAIYNCLKKTTQKNFRTAVAKYYKQNNEPKSGWNKVIDRVVGQTETHVHWPDNYLDDLKQGRGEIRRTIACYYYLHFLTHDLTFAGAVDEIVFSKEPAGERTFAQVHGGKPVFQPLNPVAPGDDKTWKSALHRWELACQRNKPANGLLASLSIEPTQGGDTRNPIALFAEVHINPAYEHESGIVLRFEKVHIEVKCDSSFPSELQYLISQNQQNSDEKFYLDGSGSVPYVTLFLKSGLDGNYISDTLMTIIPNCQSCDFDAALQVRIIDTNVVLPDYMDQSSKMKQELIRRMVKKGILPRPDVAGLILLHELKYNISATEHKIR